MNLDSFLKSLRSLASSMSKSYDIQEMCFALCHSVVDVLGADGAGVTVADDSGRLRYVTATNDEAARLELAQENTQTGPCVAAYEEGRVVIVDDITIHSGWPRYFEVVETVNVGAVLGVPLKTDGTKLGAMDIYSHDKPAWSDDDVMAAEVFA